MTSKQVQMKLGPNDVTLFSRQMVKTYNYII